MTDEFLTPEQKAAIEARNEKIRADNSPVTQAENKLLDAVRVLKPTPYMLMSGILKKTTGKGPLEHILDSGLGSMARRTAARRGMRRLVGKAAGTALSGLGRIWKKH